MPRTTQRFRQLSWDAPPGAGRKRKRPDAAPTSHDGVEVPAKYWRKRNILWGRFDDLLGASGAGDAGASGWQDPPARAAALDTDAAAGAAAGAAGAAAGAWPAKPSPPAPPQSRGIRMDAEGWYSVTPEAVALHIADRLLAPPLLGPTRADEGAGVVLDLFCGCGGNAIAFARHASRPWVVAVDTSAARLHLARHNARLYGVGDRIAFVHGDAVHLLHAMLAAPPEGGGAGAVVGGGGATHDGGNGGGVADDGDAPRDAVAFVRSADGELRAKLLLQQHASAPAPPALPVRTLFLAPPWGGPSYNQASEFDVARGVELPSPHAAQLRAAVGAPAGGSGDGAIDGITLLQAAVLAAALPDARRQLRGGAGSARGRPAAPPCADAAAAAEPTAAPTAAAAVGYYLPRNTSDGSVERALQACAATLARGEPTPSDGHTGAGGSMDAGSAGINAAGEQAGTGGAGPPWRLHCGAALERLAIGAADHPLALMLYMHPPRESAAGGSGSAAAAAAAAM